MKAVRFYGAEDIRVEQVPDPQMLNPRDAIVKVTATAICGSDLHIYGGYIPTMEQGDILGHEFMGEVVEVGRDNHRLKVGDRVVVPFTIACGRCFFCKEELWSLCDNSNPNAWMAEKLSGYSGSGLFGYSHMYGGYPGGQAEYARVPFADVGPIKVPESLSDEQVLFLSDIFPTGYMAAENCGIRPGDTIAVWGCGPVGQFAIKSAYLLGAERVIAIDRFPERLALAAAQGKAEVLNYEEVDVLEELRVLTGGQGPDACIDAVGLEAHGTTLDAWYDRAKTSMYLATDRPHALAAGDQRLPQGRHGLDPRRLRRLARQVSARRRLRQGTDAEDGADPHAQVPARPARAHRARRDRSVVHHHAPRRPGRGAGDVSDVPGEAGRLHQGRHAALITGLLFRRRYVNGRHLQTAGDRHRRIERHRLRAGETVRAGRLRSARRRRRCRDSRGGERF